MLCRVPFNGASGRGLTSQMECLFHLPEKGHIEDIWLKGRPFQKEHKRGLDEPSVKIQRGPLSFPTVNAPWCSTKVLAKPFGTNGKLWFCYALLCKEETSSSDKTAIITACTLPDD